MHVKTLLLTAIPVSLLVSGNLLSKRTGLVPNQVVGTFNVGSLTRLASTSCGQCHQVPIGGVSVTATPGTRSLLAGQTTTFDVSGTSTIPGGVGGFSADTTAGTFIAGSGTKTNASANAITHSTSASRSWSFNFQAPATPGLVEIFPVFNAGNGNNRNTGDAWGFHGSNTVANTPVRLYANPVVGVKPTGESCPDGFGNYSVLGAKTPPTVGQSMIVEAFGMAPSAPLLLMLSLGGNVTPFDMAPMGAPGCALRTQLQVQLGAQTSPGDASRGEGSLALPLPIPNDPNLRGLVFSLQFGFIDSNSTRAFPFTLTNGLECTIQ